MWSGIQLGRLFGIRIGLDWSLVFIFLLVSFNLGVGLFPAWHPHWGPVLTWFLAVTAAVLFFASVLAHELSHALVGRAFGAQVRSITLFLFGGVANLESEPDTARGEALMAIVGPVTSLALGAIFTGVGLVLGRAELTAAQDPIEAVRHMGPVATMFLWLGPINIVLGLFNLLPGFPLDGGRVLRALLWAGSRNLNWATRWASRAGQLLAWVFIVTGIAMAFGLYVPLLGGGMVQGLWLAFIGWFLNGAAVMSYRQLVIRRLLEDVPVSHLMRRQMPPPIDASSPVSALVTDFIIPTGEHVFPVTSHDRVVGLVRPQDVRKAPKSEWHRTPVRAIYEDLHNVPTAKPDQDAYQAMRNLGRAEIDELLVVEHNEPVGLVRREDITRWLELQSDGAGPWQSRGPAGF